MRTIGCLTLFAAFISCANAQIGFGPPPKNVSLYEKGLEEAKNKVEDLLSEKVFDKLKFKDKKSGKTLEYKELPHFQSKVLYLSAVEKMTRSLQWKQDEWEKDLKLLKQVPGQERSEKSDIVANYADVVYHKDEIFKLRKTFAGEYETAAEDFFNRYSAKFSSEEIKGYLGQMRRYHDTHKLVERKK